jgi:hypothetical protein
MDEPHAIRLTTQERKYLFYKLHNFLYTYDGCRKCRAKGAPPISEYEFTNLGSVCLSYNLYFLICFLAGTVIYLTINHRAVLSVMTFQRSERAR